MYIPPEETQTTRPSADFSRAPRSRVVRRNGPTTWVAKVSSSPSRVSWRSSGSTPALWTSTSTGSAARTRRSPANVREIGYVEHLQRHARVPGPIPDVAGRLFTPHAAAAEQHHLGTELRQRQGGRPADARVRARHQAAAAREIHLQVVGLEAQRMDPEAGAVEGSDDEGIDDAAEGAGETASQPGLEGVSGGHRPPVESGQDRADGRVVTGLTAPVGMDQPAPRSITKTPPSCHGSPWTPDWRDPPRNARRAWANMRGDRVSSRPRRRPAAR